ncbi:hypothetical protein FKC64_00665 [Salmonella enterica]|nr:hypothetical protein [Salmonella enterica]EBH1869391.1 hypothetical protein [Salmonella enterica]
MSNFNTRKDRDRNGNPPPHYRINYPSYIHYRDRSTSRQPRWDATKSPGWWRRLMTTRPRRAANRINVVRVLRGADPDGLSWRTGNRPQIYFY